MALEREKAAAAKDLDKMANTFGCWSIIAIVLLLAGLSGILDSVFGVKIFE